MAYTKTIWVNGQAPEISADNLNNIETGIYNAHTILGTTSATEISYVKGVTSAIQTQFNNLENVVNNFKKTLYNDATGTLGNVTLSEENFNFKYLLVTSYISSSGTMQTDVIPCSIQGGTSYIHLGGTVSREGSNEIFLFAKNYNLSGTELSVNQYAPFIKVIYNIYNGLSSSTTDELYIRKVEGIK